MTIGKLGGMIGPIVEAEAVTAPAKNAAITAFDHGWNHNRADADRVGYGSAADTGEDHRSADIGEGQAAADVADDSHAKLDDAFSDAADIHQISGKNKAGHAKDNKRINSGKHTLRDNAERNRRGGDIDKGGKTQTESDGHP